MDAQTFIKRLDGREFFRGQVAHIEQLPAREARFAHVANGLAPAVEAALAGEGISELYCHQARAIDLINSGWSVVIVTGTASGKTLCYNIPIVQTLMDDPLATALMMYPTKALAQDQLKAVGRLGESVEGVDFLAGTYDGDTPTPLRRKLRNAGNIVLTNPDMLHQGVLPHHARWNRFFANLKYVVIDELHAYRGVFGSHLANVMRRLKRICKHYGSDPQFVCCSATIDNPRKHAERICGRELELVNDDGAPRGPRRFVLWNPPPLETAARGQNDNWRAGGDRRSPIWEAIHLLTSLVKEGVQTIAFTRTRLAAELIFKNSRDRLRMISRKLGESVAAYRGGYLPAERREIERKLSQRELLGLSSTNALELGIDIGSLDACILVGYPGTIASMWQQAGRAGRGLDESIVFLIAQNAPLDQYLMMHSQYLFAQNPEQAVVDPDNPHIVVGHLRCGAHELPLTPDDADAFGPYAETILDLLEEDQCVKQIDENWYFSSSDYPAAEVNLRNIAGPVYTIQDITDAERVIGTVSEISALGQLHDHAVYIHAAETYFVQRLDIDQKIAFVERLDLDYYTQSVQSSQIRIDEEDETSDWSDAKLGFGDVTVTTTIPMFKKIRFHSRDSLGFEKLDLPAQTLESVAMWFRPPTKLVEELQARDMQVGEALVGIANVLVEVASMYVMCDAQDIGAVVDASCLGSDALFLYDRYPGGMGYAKRCLDRFAEILGTIKTVIDDCACEDGCPSCVGAAIPAFALGDIDSAVRGRIPDKAAARLLLAGVLG
ncbi:MAG: DEAD/DEAH box helicase [Phycisphaerae bacterium]|jgi:DEAD/DEAH box helicase domain-containing protein|nr:DEAD/DEAH box helicase [Phycisphaerae bacterium]